MPLRIDPSVTPKKLLPKVQRLFEISAAKILSLEKSPSAGTPVFTAKGRYTSRGWTEWTQGFQYGSAILQFDATGDEKFLEIGRRGTLERMASHVSHVGVHDHGFNNISTYGNLLRLMHEGRIDWDDREKDIYELALKVSGAIQGARWSKVADGTGYIYSFNGAHSLFVDTIRSCRSLAVADRLGHSLRGEQDFEISLLQRLVEHGMNTARFNVFYGADRDTYDVRGRTAHEAIFNVANGTFRCCSSQQGYSPFSTWTRGLAWALCGFAEQLEFLGSMPDRELEAAMNAPRTDPVSRSEKRRSIEVISQFKRAALATAEFYLENSCADGIPMWDTGAPNLHLLPVNYLARPANPWNPCEPVDSSAAAIAAQGFVRLGNYLKSKGDRRKGDRYHQAGLTIARTLLDEPYLSTNARHQGLLLHSVYHRPGGWDYIAPGQKVPNGESSMWGDYHLRELAVMLLREATGKPAPTFFGCVPNSERGPARRR